ncbi:hypothetical protein IH922_09965 [candidate division KSB1 bacterium]|nr:hypothetical protein [candidate division KSB1 bacterium]
MDGTSRHLFGVADGDSNAWRRKGHGCVSLGAGGNLFQWWPDLDWVGFALEVVCETPVGFFGDPLSDNHS